MLDETVAAITIAERPRRLVTLPTILGFTWQTSNSLPAYISIRETVRSLLCGAAMTANMTLCAASKASSDFRSSFVPKYGIAALSSNPSAILVFKPVAKCSAVFRKYVSRHLSNGC